jgi:hypothetical protein
MWWNDCTILQTCHVVMVSFFYCNRGFLVVDKIYIGKLQGGYGVFWPLDINIGIITFLNISHIAVH